jgi:non-homologous end joining protein Ku
MVKVAFAAQVREPDEQVKAFLTAEVTEQQITMVREVIGRMPDGAQMLQAEVDEAVVMRRELVEQALAGEAIKAPAKPMAEKASTDDLMAALEASL